MEIKIALQHSFYGDLSNDKTVCIFHKKNETTPKKRQKKWQPGQESNLRPTA